MKMRAIVLAIFTTTTVQAFTIVEQTPRAYECPACESLSHEPLTTHWTLKNSSSDSIPSNTMSTNQYSLQTNGAALRAGLPVSLAKGAVIRITPAHRNINANVTFFIQSPQGKIIPLENSTSTNMTNPDDEPLILNTQGETITQLNPALGSGQFILSSASKNLHDDEQYQIQIMNKSENAYISIETEKPMYVYGDNMNVIITSTGKIAGNPVVNVDAEIISPTGEAFPLLLTRVDTTTYQANATLLNETNSLGENWSVAAAATAMDKKGNIVSSKIRTAFSYAIPSAIINTITQDPNDPLSWNLTLNNATGSRYAINAVLITWDQDNKEIPLEMVQSSDWFAPGEHQITMKFSPDWQNQYKKLGLGMLEVIDYGQIRKVFEYKPNLTTAATSVIGDRK